MASNLDSHSAKKPRMTLQEALKPEMENLRIRFPTLITMVLENVDDKVWSLSKKPPEKCTISLIKKDSIGLES